jgi:hypothetical protein
MPTMNDVKNLRTAYDSDKVLIQVGDLNYKGETWSEGAYVVTVKPHEHEYKRDGEGRLLKITKKVKRFYGESAWSNAQRFANDFDFGARV